jgi:hypothetical protein
MEWVWVLGVLALGVVLVALYRLLPRMQERPVGPPHARMVVVVWASWVKSPPPEAGEGLQVQARRRSWPPPGDRLDDG